MLYLDFDLLIERVGDRYRSRVINSPAGQAVVEFSLPFSDLELENFLLKFSRPRRGMRFVGSPEMEAAKALGQRLFEAVFNKQVQGCFRSSLDAAKQQGAGLRLRFRLTETPELINVPWEYLYNPSLNRFLSLAVETPIVRYLELPESIHPLEVAPPLRILVMISSPYNFPVLNVEQEWENVTKATNELVKSGSITVERIQNPTLGALKTHLRRDNYHIFHFIGHGKFDKKAQDGLLILEDEHKRGLEVSAHTLGTLLHNHPSLRLVVLNACEGARASSTDPFAGSAQSLVQQGIPAVIAMQFEITDEAAITLAYEFYSALADGYPVDAALVEARTSIFAQGNDIEWGTPVLYMRSPDGQIFDVHKPAIAANKDIELTEQTYDVFISYSHDDQDWVTRILLPRLEREGLKVHIDIRDSEVGLPSVVYMEQAVERSRHTLIILTPSWVRSVWTTFEGLLVSTSDPTGQTRRLIPLLLKPCELPKHIGMLTHLDFTKNSKDEFQMRRLITAIRAPQTKAPEIPKFRPNSHKLSTWRIGLGVAVVLGIILFAFAIKQIIQRVFKSPEPQLATTVIEVAPPNAEVFIDGKKMPSTSLSSYQFKYELKPGRHAISVAQIGYIIKQGSFDVKPGQEDTLRIFLQPEPISTQPKTSSLEINTEPSGASVWLDNRQLGRTPFSQNEIQPGAYQLKVSLDGYIDQIRAIRIASGKTVSLNLVLLPIVKIETEGELKVTVKPRGSIYINNVLRQANSHLPYTERLKNGEYLVTAIHADGGKWEKNITIVAGQSNVLIIDFNQTATLTITATQVWGDIYIDSKNTGFQTPKKIAEVRIGLHTVEVKRADYETDGGARIVNVEKDTTLTFKLKKNN